jgi:hypothetical protein
MEHINNKSKHIKKIQNNKIIKNKNNILRRNENEEIHDQSLSR